jgi:hypothetical protein
VTGGRRAWMVLAGGATLALLLVGWSWLRPALIEPLALAGWLVLRIFVLSVHQGVWWIALVVAAGAALLALLGGHASPRVPPAEPAPVAPEGPVESWRRRIAATAAGVPAPPSIGWDEYRQLVVSLRALELRVPADHHLHDALRDGRVPLPPATHAYLFPPPPGRSGPLRRARAWATALLHRLSGRDRARRLDDVSELLSYLEDSLEMARHDRAR